MDRGVLVVGGMFIIAGGVWYLLEDYFKKKNGNGTTCSAYTSQTDCESHNCYWYDYSCHSQPQDWIPCANLNERDNCWPTRLGNRKCDVYNNLCECNGTEYVLVEKDSQLCADKVTRNVCGAAKDGGE